LLISLCRPRYGIITGIICIFPESIGIGVWVSSKSYASR
jgi:hypothetical protein